MSTISEQSEGSNTTAVMSKSESQKRTGAKDESYLQRSVRIAYQKGDIKCRLPDHFTMIKKEGEQFKTCSRLPLMTLLSLMQPFTDAKCDCERKACEQAWTSSSPGCFQTEWVNPGAYRKGIKLGSEFNRDMPAKRVFPLRFALSQAETKTMHERYPQWIFVSVGSDNHDHPVAHACTQINTFLTLEGLKAGRYLDLHGNPTSNERFNGLRGQKKRVTIDTVVQLATAKDYIRKATKWGPAVSDKGVTRYIESDIRDLPSKHAAQMALYDGLLSFHTLYYYREMGQLAKLLNSTKGKILTAIIHKFDGTKGNLNKGEQEWVKEVKSGIPTITQTNVHTGETYEHPSPDIWFNSKAWAPMFIEDEDLDAPALAWTMNRQCDDSYIVTIVAVPKRAAILDPTCALDLHDVVAVNRPKTNSPQVVKERQTVVFDLHGEKIETVVEPSHFKLFDEMRKRANLLTRRDEKAFKSFGALWLVRSKSLMVAESIEIDSEQLANLIIASYWVDAPKFNVTSATSLLNGVGRVPAPTWRKVVWAGINTARASTLKGGVLTLAEHLYHEL
jgi:hypothetical protein